MRYYYGVAAMLAPKASDAQQHCLSTAPALLKEHSTRSPSMAEMLLNDAQFDRLGKDFSSLFKSWSCGNCLCVAG